MRLTAYLETLLLSTSIIPKSHHVYSILTPTDPSQRGAQLSILLEPGLLDIVMHELEIRGVVTDERKPDVIRVAPAPLYNTFTDVFDFAVAFDEALSIASAQKKKNI